MRLRRLRHAREGNTGVGQARIAGLGRRLMDCRLDRRGRSAVNAGSRLCTMCPEPMTPGGCRVKPSESPADNVPEAASPFPPAFRWEASPPEASTPVISAAAVDVPYDNPAETTQVFHSGDIGNVERTYMGDPGPSYQQGPDEAGDLFQPAGTPPSQPTTMPDDSSAPPWASSAQPLIAEQQSAWLRQGPEVFHAPATAPRSKQLIGLAVLGIVVMGLLGATLGYFLTARSPDRTDLGQLAGPQPTAAAQDLPSPPPPLPAPANTTHALIDPPGQTRGGGGQFDLPRLLAEDPKPLQPAIVDVLKAGGMTDGVLKTTTTGTTTIGMFALTMPDERTATSVAQTIATAQLEGGLKADNNRALRGVAVMGSVPGSQSTAYRAVYVLYNRTIYVEVFGTNRDAVLTTFDAVLAQQVTYAPPTVRVAR